jgi:hypothetical protein
VTLERGTETDVPLALGVLGSSIREGFDTVDKFVLSQYRKRQIARRAIHAQFKSMEIYTVPAAPGENFGAAMKRIKDAALLHDLIG